MRLSLRFLCSLLSVSVSASISQPVHAQSASAVASHVRVTSAVQPAQTARLKGHIPAWAASAADQGSVSGSTQLNNLHLVLSRAPEVQAAFESLLADLYNPSSPRYHQWLTPQQNAAQFGIAPSDLQAVKDWLNSQGLRVDDVAAGGVFITFSGPSSAVERAFSTTLHNFAHDGLSLRAPVQEPAVPTALAGVIQSIAGLDDTRMKQHSTPRKLVTPKSNDNGSSQPDLNASNGAHFLSPGDFNIIYDVTGAATAGYTGTGQKVLVLGYSRIAATDITNFETYFSLGVSTQPTTYLLSGSADPGMDGVMGWQGENTLDVERVIGTAPGAAVDLSIAATSSYTNTFGQLQWNISTQNDKIVSMSFGSGESSSSSSTATSFNSYLQTGAAQGITAVVSSGDVGAAGGDANGAAAPATQVLEINVICASGYVTCVGGTEFSETTANASTYWASTNSSTKSSALSYIPEGGWNDIAMTSGKYYPSASGGGASQFIAKPSWQVGTGVPADGMRDSPDVAFTASGAHDGYVLCITDTSSQGGCVSTFYTTGGTSASAPSMAGIIAILNQRLGSAEGNINPLLYSLASTSPSVFHDTTVASSGVSGCVVTTPSMCNNSTPATTTLTGGLSGYLVGTGYDQVTGLGSIDVNNLLTAAAAAPRFTLSPTSLSFLSGATTGNSSVVTLTSLNGFAGPISAIGCTIAVTSGGYYPATCAMSATTGTLTAGGTTTSTLTITSTTAHAMLETPSSLIGRGTVLAGGTLFAALLLLPGLRRRRIVRSLAAAGLLFCGVAGLNGCGGSSTVAASAPTTHSSAGTYVVTITATGTNTGSTASTTATTTVGVTIN